MYERYWGLDGSPFSGALTPRWFYDSPSHEEALARLCYLVEERRRLGILTGPAGTGKSQLLSILGGRFRRSQRHVVCIDACGIAGRELTRQLLDRLRLGSSTSEYERWRSLADYWHALRLSGEQMVLLVDHLDRSEPDCMRVLEHVLRHAEGPEGCCTMILAGTGLRETMQSSPLLWLCDLPVEVSPWSRRETAYHVYQALRTAGLEREIFDPEALDAVFELSAGVPRTVNRLCDLSLLAGMAEERATIDRDIVVGAAEELRLPTTGTRHGQRVPAPTSGTFAG